MSAPPEINESEVAAAFALRPQLPKPYRVGVFFRPNPETADEPQWRWDPKHKRAILGIAKALRASGEVGDVFAIDEATAVSDNLRAIRIAAARHGADAVLVVSGADEVRESLNGWAASYAVLLPMLFAPGSELEVRFTAHAELWDVRNEYLYLSARAEEEAHQQRALCWLDSEGATEQAQAASVKLLAGELEQRFAGLHAVAKR
ncbi:MAG TPA: hypothetical protein VK524_02165 [Polyangiaceae bacterium]|nr:hypothetical protein [Polyangiaceae bacterium]